MGCRFNPDVASRVVAIVCDSSLFISDAVTKALVVHSRARERAREASIGTYDACVSIDHLFFRLSCRSFALSTVVEAGVRRREKLFPLGSRRGERERERERRRRESRARRRRIVVVVVVEMHVPRLAGAVGGTAHEHGAHCVAPGASHGEAAVVGRRLGHVHCDGGVEAVEHTDRGGVLSALFFAHFRGAGHDVRGGCVPGDVHDVCLSQIARGVIVAFHELAGAAGVLRSLGCGRWPVRVVSRDALAAEPPRRRTRNERGKHPVRGVRSKESKARDAPARGGQRETSFGGCAPDRPPRWGSSRCKPKSRVSLLHRRGRRGRGRRGRQPRRARSRRARARGQGKERGWRRNEWQTWLGRVCAARGDCGKPMHHHAFFTETVQAGPIRTTR